VTRGLKIYRIMQFSLNVAQCLNLPSAKFDDEIRRGLKLGWDDFTADAAMLARS